MHRGEVDGCSIQHLDHAIELHGHSGCELLGVYCAGMGMIYSVMGTYDHHHGTGNMKLHAYGTAADLPGMMEMGIERLGKRAT